MRSLLIALPILFLLACSSSMDREELLALARENKINEASSIKAEASIMLKAPNAVIWRRVADIQNWQNWNAAIEEIKIRGSIIPGRKFEWVLDGEQHAGEIAAGDPGISFSIVSEGPWGNRILVWKVSSINKHATVILLKESIDGFWSEWIYDKEEREKSLQLWLKNLKDSLGEIEILDVG